MRPKSTVYAKRLAQAAYAPSSEIPCKPKRAKPREIEAPIHKAILAWLRVTLPKHAFVFHTPNGGARNAIAGAKLKALGTVAGIPDLCLIVLGKVYFLEVKSQSGKPSDEQIAVFVALEHAGAYVAVVRSVDEARDVVRRWGITREVM